MTVGKHPDDVVLVLQRSEDARDHEVPQRDVVIDEDENLCHA
jgi:hypothetical protein